MSLNRRIASIVFMSSVGLSAPLTLSVWLARDSSRASILQGTEVFELFLWIVTLAIAEVLPVPVSSKIHLTLGLPIYLGLAIVYPPPVAAAVVFLGSFDAGELRRQTTPLKAVFNRSQTALSVLAGSVVFHKIGSVDSATPLLVFAVIAAASAHYLVNSLLVAIAVQLTYGLALPTVLSQLRIGHARDFLLNYIGLGFVGAVIARLYEAVGLWSVVVFILPLIFARQMFFRTMALEEASKELQKREKALRALSNRLAEERHDERMQIAAYLHDDLAQMLFRLTLQIEMAKKRLAQGEIQGVLKDLDAITATKEQTSQAIRALIRDLHRSPVGRKGLADALHSFADDMRNGSPTKIVTDVVDVSLPPAIQLLVYQIAREAAMNALKHAGAEHIWISVRESEDGVELQIRDDGKGFDTEAPPPEGHFGMVMMRERAQVVGGTFTVQSELGKGTLVRATFPRVWVEEATRLEAQQREEASLALGAVEPPPRPSRWVPAPLLRLLGFLRGRTEEEAGPLTAPRQEVPPEPARPEVGPAVRSEEGRDVRPVAV